MCAGVLDTITNATAAGDVTCVDAIAASRLDTDLANYALNIEYLQVSTDESLVSFRTLAHSFTCAITSACTQATFYSYAAYGKSIKECELVVTGGSKATLSNAVQGYAEEIALNKVRLIVIAPAHTQYPLCCR